jgi:hypothetical protein
VEVSRSLGVHFQNKCSLSRSLIAVPKPQNVGDQPKKKAKSSFVGTFWSAVPFKSTNRKAMVVESDLFEH